MSTKTMWGFLIYQTSFKSVTIIWNLSSFLDDVIRVSISRLYVNDKRYHVFNLYSFMYDIHSGYIFVAPFINNPERNKKSKYTKYICTRQYSTVYVYVYFAAFSKKYWVEITENWHFSGYWPFTTKWKIIL